MFGFVVDISYDISTGYYGLWANFTGRMSQSAFYPEKPQVLKKERGKVEKAMDVAIHDADQGTYASTKNLGLYTQVPKKIQTFFQDAFFLRIFI